MSTEPFTVRLRVPVYEIDPQLHLNGSAYMRFADESRHACVRAAGVSVEGLLGDGLGPVNLETLIRYHHELRLGDEVDVSCVWTWGTGKTYRVEHVFRRMDGEPAAEVNYVSGVIDLRARRLVPDPAQVWLSRAERPELLGLPTAEPVSSG
ncbi:acyl-CoA thioesterase [Nonomuraea jiangxiensis]|uniref:Acyl-CoA thioester hydrolase n=1 Tax=Nonomuraea jiangxiensis TaxID=633440 RepID=A0A1G8INK4_9ACTN|nr:acyl-CoA thioesterase [Nonomuraea jiangxiensis]SDI20371.1 acyl-CoA thioester hydrolase [Nonomuraea jiangxiensis]